MFRIYLGFKQFRFQINLGFNEVNMEEMCNKYYQCKMCRKIEDNLFDKILEEEMEKLEKEEHGS